MEDSPAQLEAEKHPHSPMAPLPSGATCTGPTSVGWAVGPAAALCAHPDSCPSWASLRGCQGRPGRNNQISLSGSSCFLA